MNRNGSLVVFSDDWGRHPSSCQHLVRELAGEYQVLWINTIGTRRPRLDWSTLRRGWEKMGEWFLRREGEPADPAFRVMSPLMWPWLSKGRDRCLNRALLHRQLSSALSDLPRPIIALTTLPIVADLVGDLAVDRWVYYCVDDFSKWPGLDQAALAELEEDLVGKVDAVIAVSDCLVRRMEELGRQASLLTHGVDLSFWRGARDSAGGVGRTQSAKSRPAGIAGPTLTGTASPTYEPPYVVFWGVVDERMDVDWLTALSGRMERGSILLVGPHDHADPAIRRLSRVNCPGPVPLTELPRLATHASVLVMPYRDLPVTRAMQPLKLKEYLATPRPVVARKLPAVEPWRDCLDAVETGEAFADRVVERIATGLSIDQCQARGRLVEESWSSKARQLDAVLRRGLDTTAAGKSSSELAHLMETAGHA